MKGPPPSSGQPTLSWSSHAQPPCCPVLVHFHTISATLIFDQKEIKQGIFLRREGSKCVIHKFMQHIYEEMLGKMLKCSLLILRRFLNILILY